MKKRICIVLAGILVAFTFSRFVTPSALSQTETTVVQPVFSGEERETAIALFNRVNQYRISIGVQPLVWDEALYPVARTRATEIVVKWSHCRPNGTYPDTAFKENGINRKLLSENILKYPLSVEHGFISWYHSDSHRKAMGNKNYTRSAIYAFRAADGQLYVAQEFTD